MERSNKTIGVFLLSMMIPASIFGLDAVVMPVEYGLASIFFYLVSAVLFFIPVAYIAARFGMLWPGEEGGIYLWVSKGFNSRWGLWPMWLQWIQQVIWYPTILSYMASTFAHIFFPHWAYSQLFIGFFCVLVFCTLSFLVCKGVEISAKLTVFAFLIGVILPGVILIVLAFTWHFSGHVNNFHFTWAGMLPNHKDLKNIALFNGVISAYTGVEVCGAYARNVRNPEKSFPIAIIISTVITVLFFILGTLAVVMTLPSNKMVFTTSIINTVDISLKHYHLHWLIYAMGVFIVIGSFAIVLVWVLGPMLSFYASAKHHDLPGIFAKANKNGVPVNLVIMQALVVSIFSLTFLFSASVNNAFWLLNALSAQIYCPS